MSKFLSFRKGEVKEVDETLANQLIEDGIAKESTMIEPEGTLNIIANKENIDIAKYAKANVNVVPSATMEITQNGEYNVTDYAKVNVDVPVSTSFVASSGEGLEGFTDEGIKAVTQERGCLQIDLFAEMGGQQVRIQGYCRPSVSHSGDATESYLSLAFADGLQAGMLSFAFGYDEGTPDNPTGYVNFMYACMYMNNAWVDVRSMVTITSMAIRKVDGL